MWPACSLLRSRIALVFTALFPSTSYYCIERYTLASIALFPKVLQLSQPS